MPIAFSVITPLFRVFLFMMLAACNLCTPPWLSFLLNFDFDRLWFRGRRFRKMDFQHTLFEFSRHFRSIGIFGHEKSPPEAAIGAFDAMILFFLFFFFGFAFTGNRDDSVFDDDAHVIFFHLWQVGFDQAFPIVLDNINLPSSVIPSVPFAIAVSHSIWKSAKEVSEPILHLVQFPERI